jgi:hypothetical protein
LGVSGILKLQILYSSDAQFNNRKWYAVAMSPTIFPFVWKQKNNHNKRIDKYSSV